MRRNSELNIYGLFTTTYGQGLQPLSGVRNSINELMPLLDQCGTTHWCVDKSSTDAKNDFISYIKKLNMGSEDIFLFYFCGHGFLIGKNLDSLLLGTVDTSEMNYRADVGVNCQWIIETIRETGINNYILIIDCCHSGLMSNMGENLALEHLIEKLSIGGAVILTATSKPIHTAKQIVLENREYAAFTYYFAKALSLGAKSQNAYLSMQDLYKSTKELMETSPYASELDQPQIKSTNDLASLQIIKNVAFRDQLFHKTKNSDNRMKILLVKTAIDFPVKNHDFGVPLGIWLLKSYIQLQGINASVDIFDERLHLIAGFDKDFNDYINGYDVIGVSICSCEVPPAIKKLSLAKEKGKITFVGGIFCSSNERYLLEYDCIDYVIPGVSTLPLCNLLRELIKNRALGDNAKINYVRGVITKENVSDLNVWRPSQLPYIELKVWKEIVELYAPYLNGKIDIFTARGCNQRCDFCSVQKECQQKTCPRDSESIKQEISFLYSRGFRHFSIKDEDFLLYGTEHLIPIFRWSKDKFVDITFKIRTRVDSMIKGKIDIKNLYDIGVREIQYGLETPNNILLSNIKKGYNYGEESLRDIIRKTTEVGITANCSFILGIQGETIEYYHALLDFFDKLNADSKFLKIYVNFLTPHPYKNEFQRKGEYSLVSNDLKYFTHKEPIAYPKGMSRIVRKEMIHTYEEIVRIYSMGKFNPPIDSTIKDRFINGSQVKQNMPQYKKEHDKNGD